MLSHRFADHFVKRITKMFVPFPFNSICVQLNTLWWLFHCIWFGSMKKTKNKWQKRKQQENNKTKTYFLCTEQTTPEQKWKDQLMLEVRERRIQKTAMEKDSVKEMMDTSLVLWELSILNCMEKLCARDELLEVFDGKTTYLFYTTRSPTTWRCKKSHNSNAIRQQWI